MTTEVAAPVRLPEGWEPFEKFKALLSEKGRARVYFVAVACQREPGPRETAKLRKWQEKGYAIRMDPFLQTGTKFVGIEDEQYTSRGYRKFVKPAIRVTLTSLEAFAQIWWDLTKIPNSSCGCSIVLNDAQGYDVRVMDTDHVASSEVDVTSRFCGVCQQRN